MAGKNGSTWHHNWTPTNAPAALLKTHGRSSNFAAMVTGATPKRTASKPSKPTVRKPPKATTPKPARLPYDSQLTPISSVGKLKSGNIPGLTVEQEYHRKEVLGKYTANDYAVAKAAGHKHPRDYQAELTKHIAANGIINAPQVDTADKTLSEGYHRYAAMRQLKQSSIPVRKI